MRLTGIVGFILILSAEFTLVPTLRVGMHTNLPAQRSHAGAWEREKIV